MKKFLAVALCLHLGFGWASHAWALTPFTVEDIQVQGVQRIAAGTVFNYLPIKVGDTVTEAKVQDAIRALFKTGFFNDVRLEQQGNVLMVVVSERPSIDSLKIEGTKDIDEDTLRKSLKEIGLAEGRIFNRQLLDRTEQELKRQYFARGRYAVQVKPTVKDLERNRVAITIDVSEGRIAKIEQINIVGNKAFDDDELRDSFTLTTPTIFSFFSKNDQYSKQKLASDLESLRSFYQNRGYFEFNIESTQVSITPDKEAIYLTVNITEGARYTIKDVKLAGKLVVPEAELRALIPATAGAVFSRQAITDGTKKIVERLGNEGYAFANVNPIPDIDKRDHTVAFTFFVDPGQRVYVRRINFSGNEHTRDEVLRREMRQFEGTWYAGDKIQRSIVRLRRLPLFEEVTVDTTPVPGSADQVDLDVNVKERESGNLLAGIGYSDAEGMLFNASISMKNLFGAGKELTVSADNSEASQNFNVGYLNPYFTQDGISRGFNIYSRKFDAAAANTAAYNLKTAGAGVTYGVPISEERSIHLGLAWERMDFSLGSDTSQVARDFVNTYGSSNDSIKGTLGWSYDSLNSAYFPTAGLLQRLSNEVGLPGGDIEYYKLTYLVSWYYPLSENYTFKLKGELGYGDGYSSTGELPFYSNFYAGGASSVRGYRARTLGPRDPVSGSPVGGSQRVLGNMELLFPVPGATRNASSMRLSTFVDAGMVYGGSEAVDLGDLRYSVGLGFNWFTPIAPLSLSWALPLNPKDGDSIDRVQFTLGTLFR